MRSRGAHMRLVAIPDGAKAVGRDLPRGGGSALPPDALVDQAGQDAREMVSYVSLGDTQPAEHVAGSEVEHTSGSVGLRISGSMTGLIGSTNSTEPASPGETDGDGRARGSSVRH